ncbi:hypothetical protein BDZ91DRAFT_723323 [Kalaharituber pfeilii]|nr:hypothetical protein BDZ91DRAFT_723323 [Kalaharituber pfeilii]
MPSAIALNQPNQNVRTVSKVVLPKDAAGGLKNRPPGFYCKITACTLLFLLQLLIIGVQ